MSALSEIPFEKAFVAINGEFAWRRKDIDAALTAICNSGHATLGGEVWLITGEHSWDGLIPKRGGDPPAVWSWETRLRCRTSHGATTATVLRSRANRLLV